MTGSANPTGAQLAASFPPRPVASSWPLTEATRSAVLARVLSAPFTLDNRLSQQTRRLGVLTVLNWLRTQPGESWQQRWRASGAEDQADWRRLVGSDPAKPPPHLSPGLLVLICADVIRPGLDWLLRFAPARHNLAVEMARTRDPSAAFTSRQGSCIRRAQPPQRRSIGVSADTCHHCRTPLSRRPAETRPFDAIPEGCSSGGSSNSCGDRAVQPERRSEPQHPRASGHTSAFLRTPRVRYLSCRDWVGATQGARPLLQRQGLLRNRYATTCGRP